MQNKKRSWDSGWDGHARAQLYRLAALSFQEKLQWLDEAQDFIDTLHTTDKGLPSMGSG